MADSPSHPELPNGGRAPRFYGFDALRGGAMLLGIVLHAAITHMDRRMDGLLWPLSDQSTHRFFDVLFWWIHAWRIPLFFVMAGFFAAMLARRRGPGGFIRHRVQRILLPVTAATIILLPTMYLLWGWGWVAEGLATSHELFSVHFDDRRIQDGFRGPAHLWFLNYLVVYSFIYWAILKRNQSKQAKRDADAHADGDAASPGPDSSPVLPGWARACFTSVWRPLIFAVPTFAFLAADPGFYLAYHHLLPETLAKSGYNLAQLFFQGWFFIVGVYLYRLHGDMDAFKRHAWLYLVLAHIVFIMQVGTVGHAFTLMDRGDGIDTPTRLVLAGSTALFCWLMIWGLTGLGLTVLARPRQWVRWLSDSAYWVYLMHLPIVAALMVALRHWDAGPFAKFFVIVAITSLVTLVSYQYAVRYTRIGKWLNGPRFKAGKSGKAG